MARTPKIYDVAYDGSCTTVVPIKPHLAADGMTFNQARSAAIKHLRSLIFGLQWQIRNLKRMRPEDVVEVDTDDD